MVSRNPPNVLVRGWSAPVRGCPRVQRAVSEMSAACPRGGHLGTCWPLDLVRACPRGLEKGCVRSVGVRGLSAGSEMLNNVLSAGFFLVCRFWGRNMQLSR